MTARKIVGEIPAFRPQRKLRRTLFPDRASIPGAWIPPTAFVGARA